ncbi:MAG TPA: RNA polymerase sigma factor [Pyrinomonadaceae bacterium]|nr:RNA polymerase sigma factor [Pyrinomonadaceae bacterium]
MLQPSKIAPTHEHHEEVFLARYTRLRAWALHLTENDRERAEDIVHDAYIQFTFARPELDAIANLDGYLYTMLRNLHLSQLRRSLRQPHRSLSIVDYDSAETGLRAAADASRRIYLQDDLRQVCKYACARKETSKAGSVLILRFLHGYYPVEIAEVMRTTRAAVEERLRAARSEARQYLKDPQSLRFLKEAAGQPMKLPQAGIALTTDEFLSELRAAIFNSRQGACLPIEQFEKLYRSDDASGVDQMTLGHIVSCPLCLDEVNRRLNLPLLSERFPTDTLGNDTRSKGGDGSGDGGGDDAGGASGGQASEEDARRCRKRARDVFEHRPSELCISVNGYLLAAQKVGSELSEQTLSINVAEQIDFVEIFSEQDVRLLFVSVEETAPGRELKPSARVQLSDDRTLEATLSFGKPWPTLQVVYSDPLLSPARLNAAEETVALPRLKEVANAPKDEEPQARKQSRWGWLPDALADFRRRFFNSDFWLRPGAITAVVALILVGALLYTRLHAPIIHPAELLRRSTIAEETIENNPEIALHRTINLEERRPNNGGLIARYRIEVWHSAAHGTRIRRVYDEQDALVAGELTKTDGTASTVYRRGQQPQARTAPDAAARAILETGELWRLDASAKTFNALVGRADNVSIEERGGTYVLNYRNDAPGDARERLLGATLILKKADLHATEQTLLVLRDGETREYKFVEALYEQRAASAVGPQMFEPEPELSGQPASVGNGSGSSNKTDGSDRNVAPGAQPTESVASAELEIEVTYLLNQIKADLGEQVSMTRTTGGSLRVDALVETEGRKGEILRALGPVLGNPAVRVEVSTVDEAVKRQQQKQPQAAPRDATTVREIEVADSRIPADRELRAYFSARLVGEAVDQEINRYSQRVMSRSRQALLRASALKQLVRRFSPAEMRSLAPEAQAKWLSMIVEHAQGYRREVAALRQELRSVFGNSGEGATETVTEANLAEAAERLLRLSYANDEAVRSAFTISADNRTAAAIKSAQFWRSLASAEKLAEAIQRLYQK